MLPSPSVIVPSYPSASKDHMHITRAHLPQDIVKALVTNPPLVQKAVEAFYTRDAIQMRVRSLLEVTMNLY